MKDIINVMWSRSASVNLLNPQSIADLGARLKPWGLGTNILSSPSNGLLHLASTINGRLGICCHRQKFLPVLLGLPFSSSVPQRTGVFYW